MLLAAGFRLFYLCAAVYACLAMVVFLAAYTGWMPLAVSPFQWHAHELVFGFAAAVVAGFLLTAVPNWTGRPRQSGWPLVLLAVPWLAARVVMLLAPALWPAQLAPRVMLAGACWVAAYAAFLIELGPVLLRPRLDGRPG